MRGTSQIGTDREVQGLRPATKPYEVSISGARGLLVRVFPDGTRMFEARYTAPGGKRRRMQLGMYPTLTLSKARTSAGKLRGQVVDGTDPAGERAAAKQALRTGDTLAELAEAYYRAAAVGLHGGRKRPKKQRTIDHERAIFEHYIAPKLGSERFAQIKRTDIRGFMRDLATDSNLAPASVAKIGAALSSILGFGVYEDRLEHNPAAGLSRPLAVVSRERLFGDDALEVLWKVLVAHSSPHQIGDGHNDEISRLAPQTCLALRFLILTLSRRGETCGARWEEIDRRAHTWTIPRDRTKSGRAEVKPLSDAALAILDSAAALPDTSPSYVFPSPCNPDLQIDPVRCTRALARLCERLDLPHGSPHDFRRSGATTLAGQYGFNGFTIGRVLGHLIHEGAVVTSVYNRYDHAPEKRRALDVWAQHVVRLANGQASAPNVIDFLAEAIS